MSTKLRAAIIGSTGYGGVELIRLLLSHPNVEITSVISTSRAGVPIADGFPHLNQIVTNTLDGIDIGQLQQKADVVFTATPHGVATELAPKLVDAGLKVIDLSGDFRLKSGEAYERWYKHKPADPAYVEKAVYGLSEVFADEVRGAGFISNPGCFPTATLLGLVPVVSEGWADLSSIIIDAKTGVSGGGRGLSLGFHYSEINENLLAYKVNRHQHTPEIEQVLSRVAGEAAVVTFTTHLVPMTRGILSTMYVNLREMHTEEEIINLYRRYYEGRRFVRIRPAGKWPATKEVWGSNYCDIGISLDQRTGRLTIISVIDNLVKGAAGQAIQNLNLLMGWDEGAGLAFTPVYP
ncbi:N-acetyl-gamma-glutamyl-phosphate reductase [Paenibacillus xerothermodurans]|uniref:N-acetyl-gamma-glutamyl-phosphate reductase n=1 Tax=Paenibacillus xerothermodurans TaxID=1977292 RepID=A0A2W1NI97_PAEXE|nr:N-acetyl-gamma-glutamyl-phosphate reductase [Paenibacillus xerothermodurans]PZE19275.1 N-acetyl-gamma-glutamyl-phosphate reductase [Paenibacillus xerothermodurans]